MNAQLLAALRELPIRPAATLEDQLTVLLMQKCEDEPLTIKRARDEFSAVNRRAREGRMQLVRGSQGEETVIVSIRDLATLLQAAASSLTFGQALSVSGFKPAGGSLIQREGAAAETPFVLADA